MRDILDQVDTWLQSGKKVALATVVKVYGSAPRPLGSKMAVTLEDEFIGSVSGGCVEGAVVEIAHQVLAEGRPQLVGFGISDQSAWDIGLACGGKIEVFIERVQADQ